MRIEFRLTMPGINSWNGTWTGAGKNYLIYLTMCKKSTTDLFSGHAEKSFHHDFGDGWRANVSARIMDVGEKKKKSAGFCGYDWMVDNILAHNQISDLKEN